MSACVDALGARVKSRARHRVLTCARARPHAIRSDHVRLLRDARRLGERHPRGGTLAGAQDVAVDDARVLEAYAIEEAEAERETYAPYRAVLGRVIEGISRRLGIELASHERDVLARSLPDWRPFPDTVDSLARLAVRARLGIISNIDEDLFAATRRHLPVVFEWIVTAEAARAYKPSRVIFDLAIARIGVAPDRILHVGQSLYHDVPPARALGLGTVLVSRPSARPGGATFVTAATPDLIVADLRALADLIAPNSREDR